MTKEELVLSIQGGKKESIPLLWEQTEKLITLLCKRYYWARKDYCAAAGVTLEDLEQEGYFAMLEAVNAYQKDSGYQFNTYIQYPLRTRLNALIGLRTQAGRKSPLNTAKSLDTPLNEEEDLTIADTIEDEKAAEPFGAVERRIYNESLRKDLDACISTLPKEQREVIYCRYDRNKTLKDTALYMGLTLNEARAKEQLAISGLRRPKNRKRLEVYKDDIISRYGYRGGFTSWKYSGYSSTERAAIKLIEGF